MYYPPGPPPSGSGCPTPCATVSTVQHMLRRLFLLAAVAAATLVAEDFTGKVVAITDGDTIRVMRGAAPSGPVVRHRLSRIPRAVRHARQTAHRRPNVRKDLRHHAGGHGTGVAVVGMPRDAGLHEKRRGLDFRQPEEWDAARRVFLNAPVHAVMLTPRPSYIAETSGERKYWDIALESFRRQTEQGQLTDRLKLLAQLFRNSQRFPWYLPVESPIQWTEKAPAVPK